MNRERRVFILVAGAISATAAALGYVEDTARADEKKFPQHAASQTCERCALGQFKTGESYANCTLFAGKQVSAKGWCSAFVKRAA